MALKAKFLKGLGLNDDQCDAVLEAHADTLNDIKAERDRYKADAEKLPEVQRQLDEAKNAAKDGNKDNWKVKYDALKEEYDDYKTEQENKEARAGKEKAYRALLKDAGISEKVLERVLKVSDIDSVELDDKGEIKDAKELKKNIQTEWAEFIVNTQTKGADVSKPPVNNGAGAMSKDEIYKKDDKGRYVLSATERQKALGELQTQTE